MQISMKRCAGVVISLQLDNRLYRARTDDVHLYQHLNIGSSVSSLKFFNRIFKKTDNRPVTVSYGAH